MTDEQIKEQLAICEVESTPPSLEEDVLIEDGWHPPVAARIAASYAGYPEALRELQEARAELEKARYWHGKYQLVIRTVVELLNDNGCGGACLGDTPPEKCLECQIREKLP